MSENHMHVFHHLHVMFRDDDFMLSDPCEFAAVEPAPAERFRAQRVRGFDRREDVRRVAAAADRHQQVAGRSQVLA